MDARESFGHELSALSPRRDDSINCDLELEKYSREERLALEQRINDFYRDDEHKEFNVEEIRDGKFTGKLKATCFNDIKNQLLDSLNAVFTFEEAKDLLEILSKKKASYNMSLVNKLIQVIKFLPVFLNAASKSGFDLEQAKKVFIKLSNNLCGDYSNSSLYDAESVKYALHSAAENKIDEDEFHSMLEKLLEYKKNEYKYFSIFTALGATPALFESGLKPSQVADLLICVDHKLGDCTKSADALKTAVKFYRDLGFKPDEIYESFMFFCKQYTFPLTEISEIFRIGMDTLKLKAREIDKCLRTGADNLQTGYNISALAGKLEDLDLFAKSLESPVAQRLRQAILVNDHKYFCEGKLVVDCSEAFLEREGPLANLPIAHKVSQDRATGLTELYRLACEEKEESIWYFSSSQDTWYSVGGLQEAGSDSVQINYYSGFDLDQLAEDLEVYHVHPVKLALDNPQNNFNYKVLKDWKLVKKLNYLESLLPSLSDMKNFNNSFNQARIPRNEFTLVHGLGLTKVEMKKFSDEELKYLEYLWSNNRSKLLLEACRNSELNLEDFVINGYKIFEREFGKFFRLTLILPNKKLASSCVN